MPIRNLQHVAMQVPDLDVGRRFYTDFGLKAEERGNDVIFKCLGRNQDQLQLLEGAPPSLQVLLRQPGSEPSSATGTSKPSAPLGPREKTKWVYSKLRRRGRSQAELCEIYSGEFGKSAKSLLAFLAASKYFRKTGNPGAFSWSISTNRENDLREYLA